MREVFGKLKRKSGSAPRLYADATGVGKPILDLLEEKGIPAVACYFNHGDRRTEKSWREVTIGKAYLVSRLQALLQTRRLHLPNNPEASALAEELLNYEIRVDENANDRYGAFRVGTHDDLVTALGLAVQTRRTSERLFDEAAMSAHHGTSFVGIEIGTNRDPSAIAVVEVEWRVVQDEREAHFHVRFLEAMAASQRYLEVARRTAEVCAGIKARGRWIGTVFVNVTGSGTPPLDLIREKLPSERMVAGVLQPRRSKSRDRRRSQSRQGTPRQSAEVALADRPAALAPHRRSRITFEGASRLSPRDGAEGQRAAGRLPGRHARRTRHRHWPGHPGGSANRFKPLGGYRRRLGAGGGSPQVEQRPARTPAAPHCFGSPSARTSNRRRNFRSTQIWRFDHRQSSAAEFLPDQSAAPVVVRRDSSLTLNCEGVLGD